MARKSAQEPDTAALEMIREQLDAIARRTKWKDLAARSRAIKEIEQLNSQILDARRIRQRYRNDIPKIRQLYSLRVRAERSPGPPIEPIEFSTTASCVMQDLEEAIGAIPLGIRMHIYRAMLLSYWSGLVGLSWLNGQERKRTSDRLNAAKRQIRSLDKRNADIVAEWQSLAKDMPGKGQRDEYLAEKYGLESARQIINIRKKAGVK